MKRFHQEIALMENRRVLRERFTRGVVTRWMTVIVDI